MSRKDTERTAEQSATLASLKAATEATADFTPDDDGDLEVVHATVMDDDGTTGREVAVRETPDIEPVNIVTSKHPAMVSLAKYLTENMTASSEADDAVADIIAQVLQADSVDEVLADVDALHWHDFLDVPVTVYACKWQRSEYEKGMPFYVVVDGQRHDTGVRAPITIGAQTVIAQLVRLAQLNAFPCTVTLTYATDKPTKSGYRPLKLSVAK
jgi:hypothetical protein